MVLPWRPQYVCIPARLVSYAWANGGTTEADAGGALLDTVHECAGLCRETALLHFAIGCFFAAAAASALLAHKDGSAQQSVRFAVVVCFWALAATARGLYMLARREQLVAAHTTLVAKRLLE